MKLSSMLRASFVALTALVLTDEGAFATAPKSDEQKLCERQGGFWVLDFRFDQPTIPELCNLHVNGFESAVSFQCGHCYYPSSWDCFIAGGTWHPTAQNYPLGYCTLPNHSIQTNYPGQLGGGGTTGPGGDPVGGDGGVDCSKFGLVSNGIGGCRGPNICDIDPGTPGCCAFGLGELGCLNAERKRARKSRATKGNFNKLTPSKAKPIK
jgi:hypothetical protein